MRCALVWLYVKLPPDACFLLQVCPKGLNPGKAIAKIKQEIHASH